MSRRFYLVIFLMGLLVAAGAASLEPVPGYMDADYYYAGALRLAAGQGAEEPYLWNYLNDPDGLPAPAFAYWMPLTSLIAAAGLRLLPGAGFWGARLGFLLLAALVPVLTAWMAHRLFQQPRYTRLAGFLALFPGFYLAYQTTTDAFPIYMVLGGLFVVLAYPRGGEWLGRIPPALRLLILGILAGLLHLSRADGVLWLAGAVWVAIDLFHSPGQAGRSKHWMRLALYAAAVLAGYGLIMAPWFARNLGEWNSLFPPGGSRAAWITEYAQTMTYPASQLTLARWLEAGWGSHAQARLEALSLNFQTALAVQGGIVLFPFILAGLWQMRGCPEIRLGALMWLATAGVMTLVFPFAGSNGGFFHSGAALQPLWWALAPAGVESLMQHYARWRRLSEPGRIVRFMMVLLAASCVLLTGVLYVRRVVGSEPGGTAWTASDRHYRAVEARLAQLGAEPGAAVLVNNPAGYWLVSGRPAAVIPYGDETVLLDVARRYGIAYVILETTNPVQLGDLYHGRVTPAELEFMDEVGTTRLYRVVP